MEDLSHATAGHFFCVFRWNGSQYLNVTGQFPQPAQVRGLEAQARYLEHWQQHPNADYHTDNLNSTDELEDPDIPDASEYWANFMAFGQGNEAKIWLLQHANAQMRAHLLTIENDIRKAVPIEGAKLDVTMGDGTILDKASETASPPNPSTTAPSPEADSNSPPVSQISPIDGAAAALGSPSTSSRVSSALPAGRDTMAAYASAGSGLSDDPISPDRLESEQLSADDLQGKSLRALSISHNTIFARHGCIFTRPSVKSYFEAQSWYHPDQAFSAAMLTPLEQKNVQTIRAAEHARFGYGPPISMGLGAGRDPVAETATPGSGLSDQILSLSALQNSRLTEGDLDGKSLAALSISYNAIYATHGYVFQRKSLQNIFGQMSWYHPNPAFSESDLTETEKANVQTIRAFERKRFNY